VVVNTRVDLHAKVLLPSIRKGKDVFCEWPLDRNEAVAREILEAAREGGGKTVVGLQGRFNPVVNKVKCLIEEGRIGKVLSSTLVGMTGNSGADESVKVRYMNERKVGGNILTIHFGHSECSILSLSFVNRDIVREFGLMLDSDRLVVAHAWGD